MEATDINVLHFRLVHAQHDYACAWCSAPIPKGMRHRKTVYVDKSDTERPRRFHCERVHESHLADLSRAASEANAAEEANRACQEGASC